MKNYVLRYTPEPYKDNNEMLALYGAEKNIYIDVYNARRTLYNNLYINSANLDAIKKYEKTYEIIPDSSLTLEQRRQTIINKLILKPPFTRHRLKEILDLYYGEDKYIFIIYPTRYEIFIDPDIPDLSIYNNLMELFRTVFPVNMTLLFSMPYTYIYLKRYMTYGTMAELTYGELSQYANTMNISGNMV